MARTSKWNNDEVRFVLDQHAEFDCYSASPRKQQSARKIMSPLLGHIILIPSQPVLVLSPKWCLHSAEATDTNFIVFDLTRIRARIHNLRTHSEHANHYTTDVVKFYYDLCYTYKISRDWSSYQQCNLWYTITTIVAGTDNPSGRHDITPSFNGVRVTRY